MYYSHWEFISKQCLPNIFCFLIFFCNWFTENRLLLYTFHLRQPHRKSHGYVESSLWHTSEYELYAPIKLIKYYNDGAKKLLINATYWLQINSFRASFCIFKKARTTFFSSQHYSPNSSNIGWMKLPQLRIKC